MSPARDPAEGALEEALGTPAEAAFEVEVAPDEWAVIQGSMRDGRRGDATILIFRGDHVVCIVKHGYPPGVCRPPSGGVRPGESIAAAAVREAEEETGLLVEPEAYLLRVRGRFRCGTAHVDWTSHCLLARPVGGALGTKDPREIREVVLGRPADLLGPVRDRMLAAGGGLRYRALLLEALAAEAARRGRWPPGGAPGSPQKPGKPRVHRGALALGTAMGLGAMVLLVVAAQAGLAGAAFPLLALWFLVAVLLWRGARGVAARLARRRRGDA